MAHERVLLVDDEVDFTALLKERLESRGLNVETASSGLQAVGIVQKRSFDVIILDLLMPGMDGIETLKEIMKHDAKAQVILLTGHATALKGVEAMKHGAADFLEKPTSFQELFDKIGAAAVKRMTLVEENCIEKIEDLLKSRGW